MELGFWVKAHFDLAIIESSEANSVFCTLGLLLLFIPNVNFAEALHGIWVTILGRPRHMSPHDFAITNHLVLHVELKFFIVLRILILMHGDDVVEDEAARWFVVDHLPEYFGVIDELFVMISQQMRHLLLGWRLSLLDKQDLALDLHSKHQCHSLLAIKLILEVHEGSPSENVACLHEFDILNFSELIAKVGDYFFGVTLREVRNVQTRVIVDFGELLLLKQSALLQSLGNQGGRSAFLAGNGASRHGRVEVRVPTQQLFVCRHNARRVLRASDLEVHAFHE